MIEFFSVAVLLGIVVAQTVAFRSLKRHIDSIDEILDILVRVDDASAQSYFKLHQRVSNLEKRASAKLLNFIEQGRS